MTASDLYHAGRLSDAIDAQVAAVKASPTDNRGRLFLFDLLLLTGDLDRARKQLDALRYADPKHLAAVACYRDALAAEAKRRAVFAGAADPECLTAAPDHVKLRLDAIKGLARGDHAHARQTLDRAADAAPSVAGTLNGKPFDRLTDADDRLGAVLEVFGTGGVYAWVPLESVRSLTLANTDTPRDVAWRMARLQTADGVDGDVLVAGLYPDTYRSADDELRLGRAADWQTTGDVVCGVGGRLFHTADGPVPFLSVTELTVTPAA
jgi:type VI secretion system protein ImpE